MSVSTAADEYRDDARSHIDRAVQALAKIVVDRCWGADDLTPEVRVSLAALMGRLVEIREAL
jgi:hypothetical protein